MLNDNAPAGMFVGQLERDPEGALWAVLYCGDEQVTREQVSTVRRGKRRVADLVLSAADAVRIPAVPAPTHINRLVEQRSPLSVAAPGSVVRWRDAGAPTAAR
jgi:hypothetical protein